MFLSVCLVILPVLAAAQEGADAMRQGQIDAAADVNGCLWLGGGFLCNMLAVGVAFLIEPNPPAARLLGKSPEYVAVYTNAYRQKAKTIQVANSVIGCLASAALFAIFILSNTSE